MLRRENDAVDFDVSYNTYKSAIGVQSGGSYWMGLEAMHELTSPCPASLRMEQLDSRGIQHFTYFKECFVGPSSGDYAAKFIGSTADHCNSLQGSRTRFSARDHDVSGATSNRAETLGGGWWWSRTGGNALTVPFTRLQCSNLGKLEVLLLTRDGQDCHY